MRRADGLAACRETIGEDLVVTCLGGTARDWLALRERNSFCVHHAMGLTTAVALGLAMAAPAEPVWTFEADGGLLMNLGFLGVVAKAAPANLRAIVFDNETYLSGGRIETLTKDTVDLAAVARASGWESVHEARETEDFVTAVTEMAARPGPSLLVAKIEPHVAGPPLTAEYVEMKMRFVRDVERKLGTTILLPAEQVTLPPSR